MLFTDGLANQGIVNSGQLVAAVSAALSSASAKLGGPINFFTFGFGADHNEDCLRALATGSGAGGLYYYVSNSDDIPNAFADVLGGLTSVVAQNATLSLAPSAEHGVSISRVLGNAYAAQGGRIDAIELGDLFADDAKDILVELDLPSRPQPSPEPLVVLRAELRAFNVARSEAETVAASVEVA